MCLQAVEAFVTGVAHAALPGLPYSGGDVGSPQPVRLPPGPAETSAAKAIFTIFKHKPHEGVDASGEGGHAGAVTGSGTG